MPKRRFVAMNPDIPILCPSKRRKDEPLCSAGILVSNEKDARRILSSLGNGKEKREPLFTSQCIYKTVGAHVIAIVSPILGAPLVGMVLETLIAKEIPQFLYIGSAGSFSSKLQIGDLLVAESAFCQEGTSLQYGGEFGQPVLCNETYCRTIIMLLDKLNVSFHKGALVTTDAPFRETINFLNSFEKRGALAIEMEVSALYKVAEYYQCTACAILCISDMLINNSWQSGFSSKAYIQGQDAFAKIVLSWINSL